MTEITIFIVRRDGRLQVLTSRAGSDRITDEQGFCWTEHETLWTRNGCSAVYREVPESRTVIRVANEVTQSPPSGLVMDEHMWVKYEDAIARIAKIVENLK